MVNIMLLEGNNLGNGNRIMRTAQNTRFIRSICLLLYLRLRRFLYIGRSWWMDSLRVRICRIQSSHDTTWLSKEEHLLDRTGTRETHDCPFVRWAESPSRWHSSNSDHLKDINIHIILYAQNMRCSSGTSVFGSHKCHMHYILNILSFICNKAEVPFVKVYNARRIIPSYLLKAILLEWRKAFTSLSDYPMWECSDSCRGRFQRLSSPVIKFYSLWIMFVW
jgi:hypothetical protein